MTSNRDKMIGRTGHTGQGVGGRDCPCCAAAPGKPRKAEKRAAKRTEKRAWKKEIYA